MKQFQIKTDLHQFFPWLTLSLITVEIGLSYLYQSEVNPSYFIFKNSVQASFLILVKIDKYNIHMCASFTAGIFDLI